MRTWTQSKDYRPRSLARSRNRFPPPLSIGSRRKSIFTNPINGGPAAAPSAQPRRAPPAPSFQSTHTVVRVQCIGVWQERETASASVSQISPNYVRPSCRREGRAEGSNCRKQRSGEQRKREREAEFSFLCGVSPTMMMALPLRSE